MKYLSLPHTTFIWTWLILSRSHSRKECVGPVFFIASELPRLWIIVNWYSTSCILVKSFHLVTTRSADSWVTTWLAAVSRTGATSTPAVSWPELSTDQLFSFAPRNTAPYRARIPHSIPGTVVVIHLYWLLLWLVGRRLTASWFSALLKDTTLVHYCTSLKVFFAFSSIVAFYFHLVFL